MEVKRIKQILDNKRTRTKILEIINLRQQERFLNHELENLRARCRTKQIEVERKYQLGIFDLMTLISVIEKDNYVDWLKKYNKQKVNSKKK